MAAKRTFTSPGPWPLINASTLPLDILRRALVKTVASSTIGPWPFSQRVDDAYQQTGKHPHGFVYRRKTVTDSRLILVTRVCLLQDHAER